MKTKLKGVLTDRGIKALKPAAQGKRDLYWDAVQPHLALRVTDKGTKSFIVVRRRPGDRQPLYFVLGKYPVVTLKDARERTPGILKVIESGKHPKRIEEQQARDEAKRRNDTFSLVAEDFIKRYITRQKLRSARAFESLIRRDLISRWGKKPVSDVTRRDVVEMLEEMVDRGSPYAAHHALAATRKLFNWALGTPDYGLDQSPCARIKAADVIGETGPRTRLLSDEELRLIWRAASELAEPYPFGTLVKVLMLTGQRLREIGDARWSEVDLKNSMLTIPASRMKNKVAHAVPLTPKVAQLLDGVPRFEPDHAGNSEAKASKGTRTRGDKEELGTFVFTTSLGQRPFSGYSKSKARLDKKIAELNKKDRKGRETSWDPWVLHDLRRTVRTHLSTLSLPLVAELVIAHKQAGMHKVYDLHTYDEEKRAALEKWEKRLLGVN